MRLALLVKEEDKLWWSFKSSALFNSRSICHHFLSSPPPDEKAWQEVWKFSAPLRFSILVRQVHWCIFETRSLLATRRIVVPPFGVSGIAVLELDLHALWDCVDAFVIWMAFLPHSQSLCFSWEADLV